MGPERVPLLIFDGDCAFCTSCAQWASRALRLEGVRPWQHLQLEEIGLTSNECRAALQWVTKDGLVAGAERAVAAALCNAGGGWSLIGRAIDLPGIRIFAALVYRVVARYRHKLPGGSPACRYYQQ